MMGRQRGTFGGFVICGQVFPVHPNPAFRKTDASGNLEFARSRGFGVLCMNGTNGPVLAYVPFVMAADRAFDLHLAR